MISLVLVSYRSAPLAERAAATFREDARAAGEPAEVVAVVNSGDPDEACLLAATCDRVVDPGTNLGYAGGLNAGIAAARGDLLVLSNPDVAFLPGSVGALAAAARRGVDVIAGPAFFWDDAATLLLPPMEMPSPVEVLRRVLSRDETRGGRAFRRAARRALVLEGAVRRGEEVAADSLSGAVMVATRSTVGRLGPLDERYRLYYEENDWQRRLLARGGRLVAAGGARVVHRYAQSSRREPRADGWFRESERLYFETHFGAAGRRVLDRTAERTAVSPPLPAPASALEWAGRSVLVAVSPVPWFRPFILARPAAGASSFVLPAEIAGAHAGTPWFARAFDAATFATLSEARLLDAPPVPGPPR